MLYNHSFAIGTRINGKWQHKTYYIEGFLGEGANGKVYLVRQGHVLYAMKIGFSAFDLQSEVNVLKSLEGYRKGKPYLIDADDFHYNGQDYPFYVMAYIKGVRFRDYLQQRGMEWFYIIGKKMLDELVHLHEQGWVFGDINSDNAIISGYGDVELIDYGGVTPIGRSVKQFTEINDRGYWRAGSREADEAYDLFSFAILCLQCLDERQSFLAALQEQEQRDVGQLMSFFEANPYSEPMLPFFKKAIYGFFRTSREASEEWGKLMLRRRVSKKLTIPIGWLRGAFLTSALMLAATIYFVFQ